MFSANNIEFYSLEISSLLKLHEDFQIEHERQFNINKIYEASPGVYSNDTFNRFYLNTWENSGSVSSFQGYGSFNGIINKANMLYDSIISFMDTDSLEVSFWMSNITDDLYARSRYNFVITGLDGELLSVQNDLVSNHLKAIKGEWGLIRTRIFLPEGSYNMFLYISNGEMLGKPVYFDNLLIRHLDVM